METSTDSTQSNNNNNNCASSSSSSGGLESGSSSLSSITGILDLTTVNLDDGETWLCQPENTSTPENPHDWLYDSTSNNRLFACKEPQLKTTKSIDTRTFTRPKKRNLRPSISEIEQMYQTGTEADSEVLRAKPFTVPEEQEEPKKALHFDLTQPTSLHNFDSIIMRNSQFDAFNNMSPPSLINSLCESSTFSNLMDDSYIKNDPILREIRDKDFTESSLLQDLEMPMYQSITESCSSLNSDTPENFLKKITRDGTFRRNTVVIEEGTGFNGTFDVGRPNSTKISPELSHSHQTSSEDLSSTPTKSSGGDTIILCRDTIEELKTFTEEEINAEESHTPENRISPDVQEEKISTDRGLLGSADSLDRMSSLSGSSKSSNKVRSVEDVQAIVEMQDRNLGRVTSTPTRRVINAQCLWEHEFMSPITTTDHLSDSELSDEFKQGTKKIGLRTWTKPSAKTLGLVAAANNREIRLKTSQRTTVMPQPLKAGNNLQNTTVTIGGSQQELHRVQTTKTVTNLTTMQSKLKGSYTSLRPISANLPVAPPPPGNYNTFTRPSTVDKLNSTRTISGSKPKVSAKEHNGQGDATFRKPQQVARISGLPRPTGIPRPATSRIPAPRSTGIRPPTTTRGVNY